MGTLYGTSGNNLLIGGNDDDSIYGLDGDDILYGGAGDDTLVGGNGDDVLIGGTGHNTLIGGDGNDAYFVETTGDIITELAAGGTDTVHTTLSYYTLGANLEKLVFTDIGSFVGTGNNLDNVIRGGTGNDLLYGESGNDILIGGNGDDTLDGGTGGDYLDGGAGDDTLRGDEGDDQLVGRAGDDTLIGGDGNDAYFVETTGDIIIELAAGGTDTVHTTLSHYTLGANLEKLVFTDIGSFVGTGNNLDNVIRGGNGNDLISGESGDDILIGGNGNDTLDGGTGGDYLDGGAGDDTLRGGEGDDQLVGRAGDDTLIGGDGNDAYFVETTGDIIIELAAGGTDTVHTTLLNYTLGANLEKLVFTGLGGFIGTGNNLDNVIRGGNGDDQINGETGNDILIAGNGNDTLDGGIGGDYLDGGAGDDTYFVETSGDIIIEYASSGNDTVYTSLPNYILGPNLEKLVFTGLGDFIGAGNNLNNVILGGNGNDTLDGGAGDDILDGGAGNDWLFGGAGNDTLYGGQGDDTYIIYSQNEIPAEFVSSGTDTIITFLTNYTLFNKFFEHSGTTYYSSIENLKFFGTGDFTGTGNSYDNIIEGGAGDDTLDGGAGNDTLRGLQGNDTLIGLDGSDLLEGLMGDDIYIVNSSAIIVEYPAFGIDTVKTPVLSYHLPDNVENLFYTGLAGYGYDGFAGFGNALSNIISGGGGNDYLDGADGDDWLIGSSLNDNLKGGAGNDLLDGGRDLDTLYGGEGNDTLYGGGGNDTLYGDEGNDLLDAGGENDLLFGGFGDDTLISGLGDDVLWGEEGWDTIEGDDGDDALNGGSGNDSLNGGAGNDMLYGGSGRDFLIGEAGNDILDSSEEGDDILIGGSGNDTYIIDPLKYYGRSDLFILHNITENSNEGIDRVMTSSFLYELGANLENLIFTGSVDFIGVGNDLDNIIEGGPGNDTLDGKTGTDLLRGGLGDDTYIVDSQSDIIEEQNPWTGIDTVKTSLGSYSIARAGIGGVENLLFTGMGDFVGTGNSFSNVITGGGGNDLLDGSGGEDILYGNSGNDIIHGGTDPDRLYGGSGHDIFSFGFYDSRMSEFICDQIMDMETNETIHYAGNLRIGGTDAPPIVGRASINRSTGVATFASNFNTFDESLSEIAASIDSSTDSLDRFRQGVFALFQLNNSGDYFLFISDGQPGASNNPYYGQADQVIRLSGVTSVSGISLGGINSSDLSIIF